MIVCSCNVLSADAVRSCAAGREGCPCTPAAAFRELGCRAQCGRCARTIRSILAEAGAQARGRGEVQGCEGAVAAVDGWTMQGALTLLSVKPVVDLGQGTPLRGG